MSAVTELAVNVGTSAACQALCMPRASYYRHKHAVPRSAMAKRRSPRALALAERETVGPAKWTHFYLYVILDVFSRYVTGWMVAHRESAELANVM